MTDRALSLPSVLTSACRVSPRELDRPDGFNLYTQNTQLRAELQRCRLLRSRSTARPSSASRPKEAPKHVAFFRRHRDRRGTQWLDLRMLFGKGGAKNTCPGAVSHCWRHDGHRGGNPPRLLVGYSCQRLSAGKPLTGPAGTGFARPIRT